MSEARNIIELTSARLDRIEARMAEIRESMIEIRAVFERYRERISDADDQRQRRG